MSPDIVKVKSRLLNLERIKRGMLRMDFYRLVGVDPRTGARALNTGSCHLLVAKRFAEALELPLTDILDLSEFEAAESAA